MGAVITFILSPIGRWLAGALAVLVVAGAIYIKGNHDGKITVRNEWHAAEQAAITAGQDARRNAERTVGHKPLSIVRGSDKYNRD